MTAGNHPGANGLVFDRRRQTELEPVSRRLHCPGPLMRRIAISVRCAQMTACEVAHAKGSINSPGTSFTEA